MNERQAPLTAEELLNRQAQELRDHTVGWATKLADAGETWADVPEHFQIKGLYLGNRVVSAGHLAFVKHDFLLENGQVAWVRPGTDYTLRGNKPNPLTTLELVDNLVRYEKVVDARYSSLMQTDGAPPQKPNFSHSFGPIAQPGQLFRG